MSASDGFFMFSVKLGDLSAALSSFELSLDLARTQGMNDHFQVFMYSVRVSYLLSYTLMYFF